MSDDSMSLIAFYGMGQVYLKRKTCTASACSLPHANCYEVDCTAMAKLELRSRLYEPYRAKAVFGDGRKLLSIYVSALNKTVTPGSYHWEFAKYVWKTTLFVMVWQCFIP